MKSSAQELEQQFKARSGKSPAGRTVRARDEGYGSLTRVLNRKGFDERYQNAGPAAGYGRAHCLAMLDIDHFKNVNTPTASGDRVSGHWEVLRLSHRRETWLHATAAKNLPFCAQNANVFKLLKPAAEARHENQDRRGKR